MRFNVSICFKMDSLYSYCGIILSRIAGFCTNSNKNFRGGGGGGGEEPQTSLSSRIVWGCVITIIQQVTKKVKNTHQNLPPPPFFCRTQDQIVLFEKFIVDDFLVHLSRRLKCTIVITRCPSPVRPSGVNFSHFQLLLWKRWMDFNETWQEARS